MISNLSRNSVNTSSRIVVDIGNVRDGLTTFSPLGITNVALRNRKKTPLQIKNDTLKY